MAAESATRRRMRRMRNDSDTMRLRRQRFNRSNDKTLFTARKCANNYLNNWKGIPKKGCARQQQRKELALLAKLTARSEAKHLSWQSLLYSAVVSFLIIYNNSSQQRRRRRSRRRSICCLRFSHASHLGRLATATCNTAHATLLAHTSLISLAKCFI